MRRTLLPSILLLNALPALATTYHVSTAGDDLFNGLSPGTAFATIQHAADLAIAGDSVIVHQGDYQGFSAMDHSGTAADPIVFSAGAGVVITTPCSYNNLDGINVENVSWVEILGFRVEGMPRTGIRTAVSDHVRIAWNTCANNFKWGILTGFAEHVIIEDNTCNGSEDEHGIYFGNSADDPIIRNNHVFDNNANGIHMNGDASLGGDGVISNAQVYGNIIHGNGVAGGSGINCDGVINSVIYNNLLYDNHASGISLYQIDGGAPSTSNKVYNNTIINADDARWCVNITEGCTGNQVLNNILINQHPWRGSIVIAQDAQAGFVSDYNLVVNSLSPDGDATILDLAAWQALGYDEHSQVAQPQTVLFSDPFGGDYLAAGPTSQQVDAGTSAVSPVVTVDIDGQPRPMGLAYDIGSHESGFATAVPVVTYTGEGMLTLMGDQLAVHGAPMGSRLELVDMPGRVIRSEAIGSTDGSFQTDLRTPCVALLRSPEGQLLDVVKVTPH